MPHLQWFILNKSFDNPESCAKALFDYFYALDSTLGAIFHVCGYNKKEVVRSMVDVALDIEEPEVSAKLEMLEFTCRFSGTRDQLFRLREFMTANGITYTKL